MNNYPPNYPFDLFPEGELPADVTRTANLIVRCRYAEAGTYGAALLLRADHDVKGCRVVLEPTEHIDEWIAQFRQYAKDNGIGDFIPTHLGFNDVLDMHRQALDELDLMIKDLSPKNEGT